ncbi:UDP-N-acetylglucosamine 2-epimerase (non-hydrolyzing) [Enterococcus faecalis]|nr:UDP-N-acetylglucosamine 2-epimerase (non-hydrolyzing) [Enterococcus faecalis]
MIKVMTIFGTRPEAIKMLPIVKAVRDNPVKFKDIVVITGQHREMLDQVLEIFEVSPDYDLDIMMPSQTLTEITVNILSELSKIITIEKPDIILVHGDTTTTFSASIAAFYNKVPIGHVEAGLRTWNKYSPYPEEMNRQLTDVLSDLYFAPTEKSRENLLMENHKKENIFVTGNTVIDALKYSIVANFTHPVLKKIDLGNRIILLTMHRRENQGSPMENVFKAIVSIVERNSNVEVIFPVHLSPNVRELAEEYLAGVPRIHLTDPLDMFDFHNIIAKSELILSDSGGIQEEAPALNRPVLVLRKETERPEGVESGALKLVGTDTQELIDATEALLKNKDEYRKMEQAENPYGDGFSSERILKIIEEYIH